MKVGVEVVISLDGIALSREGIEGQRTMGL